LVAQLPSAVRSPGSVVPAESQTLYCPAQGETALVFLVLVLSSPKKHLIYFLESMFEIEGRENFTLLLAQFFKVATSILDNDAWPSHWLNVNILAHQVLIKMMDTIAFLLQRDFIPRENSDFQFNPELWKDGFHMLLKLLSSDQLVIEDLSPQVSVVYMCSRLCSCAESRRGGRNGGPCGVWRATSAGTAQQSCCSCGKPSGGRRTCLQTPVR